MTLHEVLKSCPAIAILRAGSAERFGDICDVVVGTGLRAVEFTFTTPGVLTALRLYAARKPADVALGAGTVTTVEQARQAVDAGASYLVTPVVGLDVIAEGRRLGVPVIPGALTPTEIFTAWNAGAAMVKVFPAPVGGPGYLKAIRGPLPDVPLVPTGGVTADDAADYLAAGADAVGVGGPLQGDSAEAGADLGALAARGRALVAAVTGNEGTA